VACALERYRRARREYPEDLDALRQSGLIASMPRNPGDGSSMQYTREGSTSYKLLDREETLSRRPNRTITKRTEVKVWKPAPR
jgi:hypothetical protein